MCVRMKNIKLIRFVRAVIQKFYFFFHFYCVLSSVVCMLYEIICRIKLSASDWLTLEMKMTENEQKERKEITKLRRGSVDCVEECEYVGCMLTYLDSVGYL